MMMSTIEHTYYTEMNMFEMCLYLPKIYIEFTLKYTYYSRTSKESLSAPVSVLNISVVGKNFQDLSNIYND